MRLQKRKGTVDGYEWRCRNQSKDNRHDVVRSFFHSSREYYFSEENLQKDFFMRRRMNADGFIPIALIASFHRVQLQTQDINKVIEGYDWFSRKRHSCPCHDKCSSMLDSWKKTIMIIRLFKCPPKVRPSCCREMSLPCCMYDVMTLDTVPLGTSQNWDVKVTLAPVRRLLEFGLDNPVYMEASIIPAISKCG
ncbi:hypothetical protein TNCV_3804001 [Trichonephila clavipes]|nr:hypothetical protein TNCV_3804001 [Trichonephila clavipes]